jgi:hypothetical protein
LNMVGKALSKRMVVADYVIKSDYRHVFYLFIFSQ